jgi:hypothetical protein
MAGPHTPCPPQSCGVLGPGDVARHGRNHDSRWRGPLLSAGFIPQSGPGLVFHTPVVISLGRVRPPWRKRSLLGSSGIYRDSRWFIQPRIFGVGCELTRVDRSWSPSGACVAPGKEGFCWVLLVSTLGNEGLRVCWVLPVPTETPGGSSNPRSTVRGAS